MGVVPKATATVARAAALREAQGAARVPGTIVLEQAGIASAWGGWGNYSNGFVTLCTPGETRQAGSSATSEFGNAICNDLLE